MIKPTSRLSDSFVSLSSLLLGFLLTLILVQTVRALEAAGPGEPWAVIRNGSAPGQAAWSVRKGGLVPGPFQGPMACACDAAGNLWVADTLNSRLLVFNNRRRFHQAIDLRPVQKAAGLVQPPLISDLAFSGAENLLLADEANTTLLVLDLEGRFVRRVGGPGNRTADLMQINRLCTDAEGCVLVEETGRSRLAVFGPSGEFLRELKGLGGVAVRADGQILQPVFAGNPRERTLEWYGIDGRKTGELSRISETEEIRYIQPLGFDRALNLTLFYDTAKKRVFRRIASDGRVVAEKRVPFFDPGLEMTSPWWLGSDGSIFWIEFTPRQATIRTFALK